MERKSFFDPVAGSSLFDQSEYNGRQSIFTLTGNAVILYGR
jgi:hypothetical protein